MAKKSKSDYVVAGTFGLDVDEISDYYYHIDGTSRKVYAFDLMFVCAGADPKKDKALSEFSDWKKYDGDQHWIKHYNQMVWVSVEEFIHPDDVNN